MLESSGSASLCFHKASLLLVIFLNSLFSYQGSCVALASDLYNIAVLFPFVNNFFQEISFFILKKFHTLIYSVWKLHFGYLEADTLLKYPDSSEQIRKSSCQHCNLDKTSSFPVPISIFLPFFLLFCHLQLITSLFLDIGDCLTSHISKITVQSRQTWKPAGSFGYFFQNEVSFIQFLIFFNTIQINKY